MPPHAHAPDFGLYATDGGRKYLNRDERQRVLAASATLKPAQALFVLTLAWSGGRLSEILALTPLALQVDGGIVTFRTLKRRRHHMREVPISSDLMAALDRHFEIAARQRDPRFADRRLWPWHRATAWRIIKRLMRHVGITGDHACPKAFRHAFAIGTLQASVPMNLTQRWLGHARLTTTAIYANVCGPEEIAFASRYWEAHARVSGGGQIDTKEH